MSKEVRIGRTEQKRQITALSNQQYLTPQEARVLAELKRNQKNKTGKVLRIGVTGLIAEAVAKADMLDARAIFQHFYDRIYYGGVKPEDLGDVIFDPKLKSLASLPIGVLGEKGCLLPANLVPATRENLSTLCKRMIIIPCDTHDAEALLGLVVEGWPGAGGWTTKLNSHVTAMLELSHTHPQIYRDLVTGHHDAVADVLSGAQAETATESSPGIVLDGVTADKVRAALIVQVLLWASHDVQMIIARNRAAENPFGELLVTDKDLEPLSILNLARKWRQSLDALIAEHTARLGKKEAAAARSADGAEVNESFEETKIIRFIKRELKTLGLDGSDFAKHKADLDELFAAMQGWLRTTDNVLIVKSAGARAKDGEPKSFHAEWFVGLSNVSATAVAILRYMQGQLELPGLVDPLTSPRAPGERRQLLKRRMFDLDRMPTGFRKTAMDLLYAYRSALLQDKDFNSKVGEGEGARNDKTGGGSVKNAVNFLLLCAWLKIRKVGEKKRSAKLITLEFLDIVPEVRFEILGRTCK